MTPRALESLFTPFTPGGRLDDAAVRRLRARPRISKRLAELLGGEITVESEPGRGSRLPGRRPDRLARGRQDGRGTSRGGAWPTSPARAARPVPGLPSSCRVLLAEDGHDNQVLITTFLVKAGATVKVVGNGQLAVEEAHAALAAGQPYDVILMDMQMPVLDGYGATSKLRQTGYRGPIVALTAHAMAGDRQRCESAGCDDYLSKPVDRAQLTATVARFAAKAPASGAHLVSTLVDDDDMAEIVRQFVARPAGALVGHPARAAGARHRDVDAAGAPAPRLRRRLRVPAHHRGRRGAGGRRRRRDSTSPPSSRAPRRSRACADARARPEHPMSPDRPRHRRLSGHSPAARGPPPARGAGPASRAQRGRRPGEGDRAQARPHPPRRATCPC